MPNNNEIGLCRCGQPATTIFRDYIEEIGYVVEEPYCRQCWEYWKTAHFYLFMVLVFVLLLLWILP